MGKPFPGEENLSEEEYNNYSRKAIEACWNVIYTAAKETNPDCILWLTCFDITHPHIVNSKMFQEIDWLMNEEGDIAKIDSIKSMVGENTRLITCLANWNKKDAKTVVVDAMKNGVGLYGFVKPDSTSLLPPIAHYLSQCQSTVLRVMIATFQHWRGFITIYQWILLKNGIIIAPGSLLFAPLLSASYSLLFALCSLLLIISKNVTPGSQSFP
jgi:hypothetical protein